MNGWFSRLVINAGKIALLPAALMVSGNVGAAYTSPVNITHDSVANNSYLLLPNGNIVYQSAYSATDDDLKFYNASTKGYAEIATSWGNEYFVRVIDYNGKRIGVNASSDFIFLNNYGGQSYAECVRANGCELYYVRGSDQNVTPFVPRTLVSTAPVCGHMHAINDAGGVVWAQIQDPYAGGEYCDVYYAAYAGATPVNVSRGAYQDGVVGFYNDGVGSYILYNHDLTDTAAGVPMIMHLMRYNINTGEQVDMTVNYQVVCPAMDCTFNSQGDIAFSDISGSSDEYVAVYLRASNTTTRVSSTVNNGLRDLSPRINDHGDLIWSAVNSANGIRNLVYKYAYSSYPVTLYPSMWTGTPDWHMNGYWMPTGDVIFGGSDPVYYDHDIYIYHPANGQTENITATLRQVDKYNWDVDSFGNVVLQMGSADNLFQTGEIYVYRPGGVIEQITNNSVNDLAPTFGRDGQIAWLGLDVAGNDYDVYMVEPTVSIGPQPTLTLTANPTTVAAGASSYLSWTTTNAVSCSGSDGLPAGSYPVNSAGWNVVVSATTTYTLTCSAAGGASVSKSVTVTVAPAPTLVFSANPDIISLGASSNLSWTSTNASTCYLTGGGYNNYVVPVNNTGFPVSPTATSTYSLTCTGLGGGVVKYLMITVSSGMSDLYVTAVTTSVTQVTRGNSFSAGGRIANYGNSATKTASAIYGGFYLSVDAVSTTADKRIGYYVVAPAGTTLAVGSSVGYNGYFYVPTNIAAGTYYLCVYADYTLAEAESNETNNGMCGPKILVK